MRGVKSTFFCSKFQYDNLEVSRRDFSKGFVGLTDKLQRDEHKIIENLVRMHVSFKKVLNLY